MRARSLTRAVWGFVIPFAAGCGGDTSSGTLFGNKDGGDAAASGGSGATVASGGAGGLDASSSGGESGSAGSGGVPGTGGASGSVGSGGTPSLDGGCAPPSSASNTVLCLSFSPEPMDARPDPALDKMGALFVQLFDTPNPPKANANQVALASELLPADAATGGEISLDALPAVRLEGAFPATAYLRVLFVDNAKVLAKSGKIDFGVWVGGLDLSGGLRDDIPISPISLTEGQVNTKDVALTAFRRLEIVAHASAKPVGDGQGRLSVAVVNNPDPSKKPPAFGTAEKQCADVAAGDVAFTGLFYGNGPYWVAGVLNDLGTPGDLPVGALATLDVTATGSRIPKQLTFAKTDYSASVVLDLNFVNPLPADAGPPGPNSCADLGLAGADAGP